jgi:hypothetical protein
MQALTVRKSFRRIASIAALALVIGAHAGTARADVVAEKLFQEGLDALGKQDYKLACDKFAGSQKAEASVGALINLGKCNEKQGKLASAWSSYKAAVSFAHTKDDKRAEDAQAAATALEPKLSTLKVVAKTPVSGLTFSTDSEKPSDAFNVDLPIDPGEHTIVAAAPGFKPATLKVNIGAERDKQTIEVPELVVDPNGDTSGTGGADTGKSGSGLMTAGFVVGGIGAAGLVVGAIFGGLAVGAKKDVEEKCPSNVCSTQDGKDALSTAKTDANVATGGLVAGGVLLAGGAVMVVVGVVSGKKKTTTTGMTWMLPMVDSKTAGAMVGGTF